jgi:hypothetical protein
VKQENKINWAKVWCNKTRTPCNLISPEDELDSDDFDRVNKLIQEQIVLTKKLVLEKGEKESLSSSSSSSASSSSDSSRFVSSSPNSPLYRSFSEDVTAMTKVAMTVTEVLDDALADLS